MSSDRTQQAPARAGLVLGALILVAGVANLNLSVANVALPDIGKHFDSSQTMLDLIAVGYSLGLAATVLYLGALGDRYGRKRMLLLGLTRSPGFWPLMGYAAFLRGGPRVRQPGVFGVGQRTGPTSGSRFRRTTAGSTGASGGWR